MKKILDTKKMKLILYRYLRLRLQIPDHLPHEPIPRDGELSDFELGLKVACRELLREVERIEGASNQRWVWARWRSTPETFEESYLDEIRRR